jgi:Glycosyltransferase family 87
MTRVRRNLLLSVLIFSTVLKLFLAFTSSNTFDSIAFFEFLHRIREAGSLSLYGFRGSYNNIFNFPPPMIHVIKGLGALTDNTGLPFKFWLRALPSLADVGSFFLVWQLMATHKKLFILLLLLALCPISIVISGHEGNVDGLMIFFLLLSIWLVELRTTWWGGIAFGLALSVKFVPLIWLPTFFFYVRKTSSKAKYIGAAAVCFSLLSLPFLAQAPITIIRQLLGYGSIYGAWGFSKLAVMQFGQPHMLHPPYDPTGPHAVFAAILKYGLIATICVVSYWMNRRANKPSLFSQCGMVVALFLFLTPGFGVQYLAWLVPFTVAAGLRATVVYYVVGSIYMAVNFAVPSLVSSTFSYTVLLGCWLATQWVVLEFFRQITRTMAHIDQDLLDQPTIAQNVRE